ncbi:multidrug resistance outer membrane protein MdtQ [Salmonella enterica]|nr:multidrug resistance outer membrane protein MdtQ [Salmonella enterica]EDQ6355796.1 multidrug resistance outer membrane protein MdtQ [Salmonella enterica subsp. enterica serovar Java]EBC0832328.1 multidrug resistance outer membrane protein MdtQ [Salmonella enterica]EBK4396159.1 multidrug resistance outer membrane protein MdtQ [Salmonella enterica]EEF6271173.1 multidrug resistance outer membrane protein MdtQ [Salmonella enterica]
MNRNSFLAATASLPLFILLAGCAPMHDTRQSLTQQTPSSHVDSSLPAALKNGWPDSQWWKAYHDAQLDALIDNAIQHSPDMQVAEQRIQLAEAQAKAVEAQDGPQLDFSADIERQRMSAEGLMGPFAITDPAAGTTGPWYTNGTFGLTAGWDLDLWGKNRAEVTARIGAVKAREAEQEQTRQLLASGVARLYWEWQTQAALKNVLMQIEHEQQNVVTVNRELYQHGITSSVEGVETDIDASKTQQQLNDVNGKMKVIEARLSALTNTQSAALKLRQVSLPAVESQLPSQLGYSLLARAASQVETLAQKNQHQQQIEHDAQRVVGLAQARFNAGIIAGSRVSEAKIPALREQCNGLLLQGQWLDASIQLTSALGGGYHS